MHRCLQNVLHIRPLHLSNYHFPPVCCVRSCFVLLIQGGPDEFVPCPESMDEIERSSLSFQVKYKIKNSNNVASCCRS